MVNFNYNIEERNEWIARFEEQRDRIQRELIMGEEIAHCLDAEHFGGRYYNPEWVITSEARLWSLGKNRNAGGWNTPYPHERTRRWYTSSDWHETKERLGLENIKIYYHQIVANYFCNRKPIELFGEENCVPHHVFGYIHLFDQGVVQTRQECCTWNNRAKHLKWTTSGDHAVLNYLQDAKNSRETEDEIIEGMMRGITYKDGGEEKRIIFNDAKEDIRKQYKEFFENAKFYRQLKDESGETVRDENGNAIKIRNFTAIWYDYNGGEDKRRLTVKGFFNEGEGLPYIK